MKTIHVLNYYGDLSVTGDYSADSNESVVVVRTENSTFETRFVCDESSHWYAIIYFEDDSITVEGALYGKTSKKYEFDLKICIDQEFEQTAIGGMLIKKVA